MMKPEAPSTDLSTTAQDYAESYYRNGLGPPYEETEPHWERFFGSVAAHLVQHVAPRTALDVGCAKGFLVDALVKHGIDAQGVDISEYAIATAPERIRDRVSVHDLTLPLEGHWDLISCIEVIEHMAPGDAQQAIDNITAATNLVLFSSTPHDFVEATHINVHPASDWAEWFATRGFFRRTDVDMTGLSPWAVLFERRSLTAPGVVHLYETELAPLKEEVVVKRQTLLDTQRRLDEAADLLNGSRAATTAGLAVDIDRVMTLTDLVIGLQAELAESRYQHDLLSLQASPRSGATAFSTDVYRENPIHRTRLFTEIELRQALSRKLEEQTRRADEAEARIAAIEGSKTWKVARTLAGAAKTARRRRP